MIDYIKGQLTEISPTYAVVETAGGVGYGISISLNTFTTIEKQKDVKLYVHEQVREDAYLLFGFASTDEREAFRLLTQVNGVGPTSARLIMSALTAAELQTIILGEDVRSLKSIKGIGQKTAERIILDLKDKIGKLSVGGQTTDGGQALALNNVVREEALQALEVLGYAKAPASKVVDKLLKENPALRVEDIVKAAFKML